MPSKSAAEPGAEKRRLREEVRRRRAEREPAARAVLTKGLAEQVLALCSALQPATVTGYLARAGEPDLGPALASLVERGVRVLLPVAGADGTLDWRIARLRSDAGADGSRVEAAALGGGAPFVTVAGRYGIAEPAGQDLGPAALAEADLVLAPAAAAAPDGTRLGWGLGYYDRALAALPPGRAVFAVVHDDEVLAALPRQPHDTPVSGILTPTRVLRTGAAP